MPVPRTGTFMWHPASSSWVAPTGAGAIELANMLNAQTGNDIYLINGCVGGTALLQAKAHRRRRKTGSAARRIAR